MKRTHVFIYVEEEGERKFRGFFIDRPTAEAWVKKQENPDAFEISDEGPPKRVIEPAQASEPVDDVAERTDKGMDKALAAVKEAKSA